MLGEWQKENINSLFFTTKLLFLKKQGTLWKCWDSPESEVCQAVLLGVTWCDSILSTKRSHCEFRTKTEPRPPWGHMMIASCSTCYWKHSGPITCLLFKRSFDHCTFFYCLKIFYCCQFLCDPDVYLNYPMWSFDLQIKKLCASQTPSTNGGGAPKAPPLGEELLAINDCWSKESQFSMGCGQCQAVLGPGHSPYPCVHEQYKLDSVVIILKGKQAMKLSRRCIEV